MIDFILKKVSEESPHYNLTITKEVHKRTGEIVREPDKTIYTLPLEIIKNRISHAETVERFKNKDVSLKEYLSEFYIVYNEVCELLKKTL